MEVNYVYYKGLKGKSDGLRSLACRYLYSAEQNPQILLPNYFLKSRYSSYKFITLSKQTIEFQCKNRVRTHFLEISNCHISVLVGRLKLVRAAITKHEFSKIIVQTLHKIISFENS